MACHFSLSCEKNGKVKKKKIEKGKGDKKI